MLPAERRAGWLVAKGATRIGASVIAGLLVGGLVAAVLATRLFGYQILVVSSGSMVPTLNRGDLIVTHPVPITAVNVGDIVLYTEGTRVRIPVVHRVAAVINFTINFHDSRTGKNTAQHTRMLQTKGDANPLVDGQVVDKSRLLGRLWFSVPALGAILGGTLSKRLLLSVAVLSALLWLVYELRGFWRSRPSR